MRTARAACAVVVLAATAFEAAWLATYRADLLAEQERVGALEDLVEKSCRLVVEQR